MTASEHTDSEQKKSGVSHWRGVAAGLAGLGSLFPCIILIYLIAWKWGSRLVAQAYLERTGAAATAPATFLDLANAALAVSLLIVLAGFVVCAIVVLIQFKSSSDEGDPGRRDMTGIWGSLALVLLGVVLASMTLKYAHEPAWKVRSPCGRESAQQD